MMSWYLFMTAAITGLGGGYLGPMSEDACRAAERALRDRAVLTVMCRDAFAYMACPVPGHPEMSQICPVFDGVRVGRPP